MKPMFGGQSRKRDISHDCAEEARPVSQTLCRLYSFTCLTCKIPALSKLSTHAHGMRSGLPAGRAVLTWVIYLSRSLPPRLRRMSSTAICKDAAELRQQSPDLIKA